MATNKSKKTQKTFFLTGVTGVLGSRILQEVLESTDSVVYCLLRATSKADATKRIENALYCYDEKKTLATQLSRVIPVIGDIKENQFGLSDAVYHELQENVDLAIHCAANVRLFDHYDRTAEVNVKGTERVIELCLKGNISMLNTSSFSVIGDKFYDTNFVLQETQLDFGQSYTNMDYGRSKYESEKLMYSATKKGLKWVIVRPGNIWGDSKTGCYPLFNAQVRGIFYEMIKSIVEMGFNFKNNQKFDITPVDYVAKAMLYAILNLDKTEGKTLSLTNPKPIVFDELIERLIGYGYELYRISETEYMDALQGNRMLFKNEPYRSTFTDFLVIFYNWVGVDDSAMMNTDVAESILVPAGIVCPESDKNLFTIYFDYLVKTGFLPSPLTKRSYVQIVYDRTLAELASYYDHPTKIN